MLKKLGNIFGHNRFMAIAMSLAMVFGLYMFGCESQVSNPFNPVEKVTRAELQIEVDRYLSKVDLATLDLDKQDAVRQELARIGTVLATGGTVNPTGAIMGILSILGAGAVVDNRRKDKVIKNMKDGNA